jgi:DNA-binding Lrp family transcriptional regulator
MKRYKKYRDEFYNIPDITMIEAKILMFIDGFGGPCRISQRYIADYIQRDERATRRAIKSLKDRGILEIKRTMNSTATYRITSPSGWGEGQNDRAKVATYLNSSSKIEHVNLTESRINRVMKVLKKAGQDDSRESAIKKIQELDSKKSKKP